MGPQSRLIEAFPESPYRLSLPEKTLAAHGYIVNGVIGEGTYAVVKKALWTKNNITVAVKIISKMKTSREFLQKCVPRELDVIRNLRHENIIHFYEVIETTLRYYISMRYAENGSLLELVRKRGRVPEPRGRHFYRQIVSALEYLHTAGFAHRDIKLENIMLDVNDQIKLIDFGFARRLTDEKQLEKPCRSSTFCGSHSYASLEILRFIPYDPVQADIWASGVVLYSLLFEKLPFGNYKQSSLLVENIRRGVKFPAEIPVSMEVQRLLKKIFVPVEHRITWPELGRSVWFDIALEEQGQEKQNSTALEKRKREPAGMSQISASKRSKLA